MRRLHFARLRPQFRVRAQMTAWWLDSRLAEGLTCSGMELGPDSTQLA